MCCVILCEVFPSLPKVGNKGHTSGHSARNRPPRLSPAFGSSLLSLASPALILKANLCQRPAGPLEGQRSPSMGTSCLQAAKVKVLLMTVTVRGLKLSRESMVLACGQGLLGSLPSSLLVLLGSLWTCLLRKRSWISWEHPPGSSPWDDQWRG